MKATWFAVLTRKHHLYGCYVFLLLLTGHRALGQKFEPAVDVSFPHHSLKQTNLSMHAIDFRNLEFRLMGDRVRLRNGQFKSRHEGITDVTLEKVLFFGNSNEEEDRALLFFDFFSAGGSSSDYGIVQVLSLSDGRLIVTQEFVYDRQATGTGNVFNRKKKLLTIVARANDDSAHCCPQHVEKETFAWDGSEFKLLQRTISKLPPEPLVK